MTGSFDVAVVGAGILGLAHAYHFARRGLSVVVVERHAHALGASIRNFGMIWPIGQPVGPRLDLARRSRELWLEVLRSAALWHATCGSLHLAFHADEWAVMQEFVAAHGSEYPCELLESRETRLKCPVVRHDGLIGSLWSANEVTVDPRQVIAQLPAWLSQQFGVQFRFSTTVSAVDEETVQTNTGALRARRVLLTTGVDIRDLAPQVLGKGGIVPCKLQMMRLAAPPGVRLGGMIAGGLTLRHYEAFASCPSLAALIQRTDRELPDYRRWGIHVMAVQNGLGEMIVGDSHEYGDAIDPFDKPAIDELVLSYLAGMVDSSAWQVTARWHGVYGKHPQRPWVICPISDRLWAVTGVGGHGMTLSFGLAEQVVNDWLGETR